MKKEVPPGPLPARRWIRSLSSSVRSDKEDGLAPPGARVDQPLEAGTSTKEDTMAVNNSWDDEGNWWRNNFLSRPYATRRNYEAFRPAYQYGFQSGQHHMGRKWNDVETDLPSGWEKFEGRKG